MNDSTTKQCSKCREVKPLSEFYLRRRKGNPTPNPWCKACQHLATHKNQLLVKGMNDKTTTVKSEIRVMDRLKQFGIFAASGKASEYKWTDVVAWGCIPIEVKTATLDKDGRFTFAFSHKQVEQGTQSLFIVLVMLPEDAPASFHVFPSDHPIFYVDGKLKWRVRYTPNGRSHLSDQLMTYYKDAWHQIEQKRLEISKRLLTTAMTIQT